MKNQKKSHPTIKELLQEGKSAADIVQITGCARSSVNQVKYRMKKELKEMDKIDSKFKCKRDKDAKMQRMYSAYEKQVDDKALERFRERPYQLKLAERMKNNGIEEQRREPS